MSKDSAPQSQWETVPTFAAEYPSAPKIDTPMKKYGTMEAIIPDDVTSFLQKQLNRSDIRIEFTYGGSSALGNLQYKVYDPSNQHIATLSECTLMSSPSMSGWKLQKLIQ